MLLYLTEWLSQFDNFFQVFRYLTLRGVLGLVTSLLLMLFLGPSFIRFFKEKQIQQIVRDFGPQTHLVKNKTPTMGGLLIVFAVVVSTLLWANLDNRFIWFVLLTIVSFAAIGAADDWLKISYKNTDGMSVKQKFFWQIFCSSGITFLVYYFAGSEFELSFIVPIFKEVCFYLGILFIPLGVLVIVASSNALNMTDGLDGLAIVPSILIMAGLAVFVYVTGNSAIADFLQFKSIAGIGEIVVFCGAVIGAGLGFLWFNTYPAQIFMGDCGALALGAALGIVAILIRQEIVFFIMSGVLVMEALSVILQVASFKTRGKRIFLMAPLHHHFELKGLAEPKVIVRFWIVTVVLVALGLITLKIR